MNLDSLDAFSRGFAEALFAAYPDWIAHAKFDRATDSGSDYLVVYVPSPPGSHMSPGLYILTEDEEVTVGFDAYHSHFDWPATHDDVAVDPMALIGAVIDERVAAASVWEGEKWCGSWPEYDGSNVDSDKYRGPGRQLRIRSWRGTLDHDAPFTP